MQMPRFLNRLLEAKASKTAPLSGGAQTHWMGLSGPLWSGRSYETLTREAYRKNAVAHRCVRLVAECAASVPLRLRKGDETLSRHPVLDLLSNPNPMQSGRDLMEAAYAYLQIAGNSYLELVTRADGSPGEMYALRPERMRVVPGANGWPAAYEYSLGGKTVRFPVPVGGEGAAVLHLKSFHPSDDYYGLSPLEAAAFGVDIHNAAQGWNKALLDNAARPSGALVFEPRDGEANNLSDQQFTRLKDELEDHYQGAKNAGRPFLLEGGLKWQQIAFSPQDMEFIQSKNVAAREIALAFGVPPMLLGIPGDNTYANYAEANRAFWRLTLLPLVERTVENLNSWLLPQFGDGDLALSANLDRLPALAAEREALFNRLAGAGFMTANEKRAELGLKPVEGGDELPPQNPFPSPLGGGQGPF